MKPEWIIVTGLLIGVVGTLIAGYGALRQSQASNAEADSLRNKLAVLHDQSEEQQKFASGGNSYVSVMVPPVTVGEDLFKMVITLTGKYSLTNVRMWYVDMNGWNNLADFEKVQHLDKSRDRTFANLGDFSRANGIVELSEIFKVDKRLGIYLQFHFFATNGTPTEIIRGKWVEGQWRFATVIIRGLNDEPIYNIDPKYPSRATKEATMNDFY